MPQRLRHALFMHGVRRMDRRHLRFARRRQKQRVFPSALAAAPDQSARFQLVRHADQICPLQAQRDRKVLLDQAWIAFDHHQRAVIGRRQPERPQRIVKTLDRRGIRQPLMIARGFASTEEGNILTEAAQWDKLRLVVDLANEIWGRD